MLGWLAPKHYPVNIPADEARLFTGKTDGLVSLASINIACWVFYAMAIALILQWLGF